MRYTQSPVSEFYVDAYWILKTVLLQILDTPENAQQLAQDALKKIEDLRK